MKFTGSFITDTEKNKRYLIRSAQDIHKENTYAASEKQLRKISGIVL